MEFIELVFQVLLEATKKVVVRRNWHSWHVEHIGQNLSNFGLFLPKYLAKVSQLQKKILSIDLNICTVCRFYPMIRHFELDFELNFWLRPMTMHPST